MMSVWPAHLENQVLKNVAAAETRLASADRVRSLIARYPETSPAQNAEILKFLKHARYVEMQLLATDESLRRQVEIFLKAHKRQLRYSAGDVITIAALVLAFFAFCWLLWQTMGSA
jgi:hypothetical protein